MEITIIKPIRLAGVEVAAGTTQTVDAALGADLIRRGDATDNNPPDAEFEVVGKFNRVTGMVETSASGVVVSRSDSSYHPPIVVGAKKISKLTAALARSAYERVNIAVHSHSIGIGVSANDGTTYDATNMEKWGSQAQYSVMTRMLSAAFGGSPSSASQSVCSGSVSPRTTNPLFTVGGGAAAASSNSGLGPGGWRIAMTAAAHTVSVKAVGSALKIYGIAGAEGTAARWSAPSVASGATQTATAAGSTALASGSAVFYEWTITGVTPGETVTLMGPTSGVYTIYAIDADYKTTAGITVHRWCLTGAPLVEITAASLDDTDTAGPIAAWLGATAGARNSRLDNANSLAPRHRFDGVIVQTDVNDLNCYDASGTAYGYTIADHQRHLANYLAFHAAAGIPQLVVFGPIRDPAFLVGARPYDQAQLIAALKQTVAAATMAAYIDLTEQYSGATLAARYNAQVASGVMDPPDPIVHPGKLGHAQFGRQIAMALMS